MNRIYLDYNSTTPIDPRVAQAIHECHLAQYANPASQHQSGQKARRKLESLRRRILELAGGRTSGMDADRLIFTSGGTESNNLAISGMAGPEPGHVLVSSIEHPSVVGPAELLAQRGYRVVSVASNSDGVCIPDAVHSLIQPDTRLVSLMLANNETGVIQPIEEIAQRCRELGVPIHCDATQAIGKIPVSFQLLGVDAMTFSPHKFCGPRSIGALVTRSSVAPHPVLVGGFQQMGIRPGTEDVALAAGFQTAMELWCGPNGGEFRAQYDEVCRLRDRLEQGLIEHLGAVVNGVGAQRLGHTSNISFPGVDRQRLLLAADMAGLDISTGSACASGSSELSPVLLAMDLAPEVVEGSVRISLGIGNTEAEIEETISRFRRIVTRLRGE